MSKKLGINTQDKFVADSKVVGVEGESDIGRIKELALKIFKRKLGFVFKPDVENEVIEKLVTSEPFEEYIKLAEKQYNKRLKALAVNKQYPVIEVPADGKSGVAYGAYCLCFVYSKHNGNFVVKGYMREIKEYLKKNHTHYFCNYSMWNLGAHRDSWYFWKDSICVSEPSTYKKGIDKEQMKFVVRPYVAWDCNDEEYEIAGDRALKFKRMPKRWIPEFDNF